MSARQFTLDVGGFIIWHACRHMPPDLGDEKFREWTAELPCILDDIDIRFRAVRVVVALMYAIDQHRTVHQDPRASRYSWGYAVSDAFAFLHLLSHARESAGKAVLHLLAGAVPAGLIGGLVATIGLFCGTFSPPATATVVIISASVGACLAAAIGGTRVGRQIMKDIGDGLRRWTIARDRAVGK